MPDPDVRWRDEHRDGDRWWITVEIQRGHPAFAGHFPGYPVLSAAAQLHELIQPALARALAAPITVTEYADLKFLARIQPGDSLVVAIHLAAGAASFELSMGQTTCTTGTARWAPG